MSEPSGLTHSQASIWIGQRLDPGCPLYNMAFAFVLPTTVRADLFLQAWRRVADASDALRTRIVDDGGREPRRIVDHAGPPAVVLDLSDRPDPDGEFRRWCRARCAEPFAAGGALVESALAGLGEGRTGWYLNLHHAIADAWATRLIYRQVAAEYDALVRGEALQPPSLASYYATAAGLPPRTTERPAAIAHWAARSARPGRTVPLYGRIGQPSGTASLRSTLTIDDDRSRAIDRLAAQDGFKSPSVDLSRFALFAALLVSWLHRVSGQRDLGFDAPVAGRPTAEARRAIGPFIEMFPFAMTVETGDSLRTLGARCLAESALFLRHALPGLSTPSGATAGNVVLNYVPGAFGPLAGVQPDVEWVHPGHGDRVHALRLQVHDFGAAGRYTLHFDVNEGVLPERLRRRAVEHFDRLLAAVLADPDRPIASIDVLGEDERLALRTFNATGGAPLPDRTVVALVDDRASLEPERVALRQGTASLSFGEVAGQSRALAATLVAHGVSRGDRVAIVGRRSMHAVVATLAVLRARAAFVPIDSAVPDARLRHVLRDSGARVVLVGDAVDRPAALADAAPIPIADGIRAGASLPPDEAEPALDDLAYLMYTSGSTGVPKGVLIDHAGLADYLCWAARTYVRGDRLTFPLFTSLGFDLTVTSLFLPLMTGGTLEIYPEPGGPVDTSLVDVVKANAVDFIKLTPSHLALLRRLGLDGSRIRRMVVGGEDLKTSLAEATSAGLHGQAEIYNEYGPTEAVVGCMVHRFDPARDTRASVPIGVPADHVTLEILNEARTPVPEGVPGELWISRFGLARGYHGLPALTDERFEAHPDRGGERRYRTGDLVRLLDPGTLEYLGRVDRQVKIAGFRVEPGEVEAAMLSLPAIEQCAVIARHGSPIEPTAPPLRHCIRCGLPSNYPRAVIDDSGVCSVCRSYEDIKDRAQAYFRSMDDLRAIFAGSRRAADAPYDCLMLFSGGKDSTYALCRLVEMGLSVYAFTLDNGFIAESAKENIRKVAAELGVNVELATTPAMNAIFRDSLARFSNVCNGCFKTIYTLGMQRALALRIPVVVTGLSRGQMFETRLTEEMFRDGRCSPDEIDAAVLAARKIYHRLPDEVSRSLDVRAFADDRIFDEVRVVDFYRYCDVGMDEVYSYLARRVPWVRPKDTGRSTNCLINDVGIHIHRKERGFHNYALPYSWDVRMGHKTREAALDELDDRIDVEQVRRMLAEIGYDEAAQAGGSAGQATLEAFYVASRDLPEEDIRRGLADRLPAQLIPVRLRRVDAMPLTASGKVDERALARESHGPVSKAAYRRPEGPVEEYLAGVWQEELGIERIGGEDHFFELGGTSLSAMQVMIRLCREFDIELPLATPFTHPRLSSLARVAEDRILADADPDR